MKKTLLKVSLSIAILFVFNTMYGQVKIGDNMHIINPNSLLELESTNKGFLMTRLTRSQIDGMSSVPTGMMLFCTTDSSIYFRKDTGWVKIQPNIWGRFGQHIVNTNTGNVGIGINSPLAKLHVSNNSVLFSADGYLPSTIQPVPVTGSGRRMMWYADKAAFRAGFIGNNGWDTDSIGDFSIAMGSNPKAIREGNIALGINTIARGENTIAIGNNVLSHTGGSIGIGTNNLSFGINSITLGVLDTASGFGSFAAGYHTNAIGSSSVALGSHSRAEGHSSFAFGQNAKALDEGSIAMGTEALASNLSCIAIGSSSKSIGYNTISLGTANNALGEYSASIGSISESRGNNSATLGTGLKAKAKYGIVLGVYNDTLDSPLPDVENPGNRLLQIGNGDFTERSNALTILRNGNTGIGTNTPLAKLHVINDNAFFTAPNDVPTFPAELPTLGQGRRFIWYADKAATRAGYVGNANWETDSIGVYSTAFGSSPKAKGEGSFAVGNSYADGDYSASVGFVNLAKGFYSIAAGRQNNAIGNGSVALGSTNNALEVGSVTIGIQDTASGYGSIAIGGQNKSTGEYSFSSGFNNKALELNSIAMGKSSTAEGAYSIALGQNSKALGFGSFAAGSYNAATQSFSIALGSFNSAKAEYSNVLGNNNISKSHSGFVIGSYNDTLDNPGITAQHPTDRVFQIGNGAFSSRSNAYTVLRNGNTGIGNILNPVEKLEVDGAVKVADAINPSTTVNGTIRYTSANGFQGRHGGSWVSLNGGGGSGSSFWAANGTHIYNTNTGKIGIGTNTPTARLQVVDSSVLFNALGDVAASPGNVPVEGEGRRMLWYADKAAFRAGYVSGSQWNTTNVGVYSAALGINNTVSGVASTGIGLNNTASGSTAFAGGSGSIASGDKSFAFGSSTTASGEGGIALGLGATASGTYATAIGNSATSSGLASVAIGTGTVAKALNGIALGEYNNNGDAPSITIPAADDRLFQIGNGTSLSRKNAVTILRNGNFGIGVLAPTYKLEVNGAVAGTAAYVNLSDKRFKTNIQPINNALQKVMQLKGVTFDWDKTKTDKELDNNNHIGFIAQEIEQVLPQVVVTRADANKTKSVAYGDVVPVLVEAIKQQQQQIEQQQKQIQKLQQLLNSIVKPTQVKENN